MSLPPCHLFIRLSTCLITSPLRLGSCLSRIPFFPETATLQFNFASGHLSTSIPPPLQPCMNSFLCFNLSLFNMFVFFQPTLFISPSTVLPFLPIFPYPFPPSSTRQSIFFLTGLIILLPSLKASNLLPLPPSFPLSHSSFLHFPPACMSYFLSFPSLSSGITLLSCSLPAVLIHSLPYSHPFFQSSVILFTLDLVISAERFHMKLCHKNICENNFINWLIIWSLVCFSSTRQKCIHSSGI